MHEPASKSDLPDDQAGPRGFHRQAADGALFFVYDVFVGTKALRRGTLIVRLAVDGEWFVAIRGA